MLRCQESPLLRGGKIIKYGCSGKLASKRIHPLRLIFFLRQPVTQGLEEPVSMNQGRSHPVLM